MILIDFLEPTENCFSVGNIPEFHLDRRIHIQGIPIIPHTNKLTAAPVHLQVLQKRAERETQNGLQGAFVIQNKILWSFPGYSVTALCPCTRFSYEKFQITRSICSHLFFKNGLLDQTRHTALSFPHFNNKIIWKLPILISRHIRQYFP